MLDSETKHRIDTARNILVGKVPDPKSQVEQITIALIYKFMDDMDAESEEFGGKRKFFAKDFARYGWAKLMRSGLGGHETLNLYAEAIDKMTANPGIPPLFRDIFKNAYLPYRDPETLKMFLKVIDEFTYDHSEKLGDAFEYLLSVLGSQGDAGQFRTPRHIIDFMVAVVDPKKTETVLDPACGTAGFLISAYKHILKVNADKKGHSALTPDEKGRLAQNFTGYDISPDMVRLSLVNMYLHGFPAPHIYEYDTLTSQDRWNEYADVILANPPFMSPKGGIKPHNRFGVQSKRSEVLFVDYMAEHLTPNGRAAIIVPEGIVFQSQNAYTQLRKTLVENALVAVVSLPAGCFNPYSGVKTSILILDKSIARTSTAIAFFKVENDGFDLGAQRRPVDQNDLPAARDFLHTWLHSIRSGKTAPEALKARIVAKSKIAADTDYNLSADRYREDTVRSSKFPFIALGEVCELARGVGYSKDEEVAEGGQMVLRANNINKDRYELDFNDIKRVSPATDFSTEKRLRKGDIFICLSSGSKDHIGKVALIKEDSDFYFGGFMGAIRVKPGRLMAAYLFQQLTTGRFNAFLREEIAGANINNLGSGILYRYKIPLPPLEIQEEIVAETEGYQKVIDGARAVVDHYRPHIPIRPDWPMVELGELCDLYQPKTITGRDLVEDGPYLVFGANGVIGRYSQYNHEEAEVLITCRGATCGTVNKSEPKSWVTGNAMVAKPKDKRLAKDFLFSLLKGSDLTSTISGSAQPQITRQSLAPFKIPLPPLAEQKAIVEEIETEQALVDANRELIARMEKKIQEVLARVWGEEPA